MAVWDCFTALFAAGPDWRATRSDYLFILHGTIAVVIGILVGGIAEYNLGDSEVLMMFLCVLALGYAAVDDLKRCRAYVAPKAMTVSK